MTSEANFRGAQDRTAYLFTLQDSTEVRINLTTWRLYLYAPGADFENLLNTTDHENASSNYTGTALVFYRANASIPPSEYKTNAIFGEWEDPWLFWQKQFYASDPFDWDTDNDGLADGWEIDPWNDTDGDFVPNVRDFDSDGDSLTDGQEMLQVQSDWFGEHGTTASDLKFDPDGDGLYAMIDTDSDGDGIDDGKEVLWSVDTDKDNRINLVDWDADGDGLCDGWCTSNSTSTWRTNEYYEGWNITLPPGMPNGEDANANGTNEQGESSPVRYDTDGDNLWDGYAYNVGGAGWLLSQVDGAQCPLAANATAFCGEESTYSLYNGSYTTKTNRTGPDTDGDGLIDFFEVHGWPTRFQDLAGDAQNRYTISSPNKVDSEGDGLSDLLELLLGTNTTLTDTDADAIPDGTEDKNRDGFRQANETSAIDTDSDNDALCDGLCSSVGEDIDTDGVKDANEPNPLVWDTDGDNIPDGVEFALMLSSSGQWGITHDFDGDGLTDLNDPDSDNDGLDDGVENHNHDDAIDGVLELDPYDSDTDDDGQFDGAEASPFEDTDDNDTDINGRDQNSNDDGVTMDYDQIWVVFRTNAVAGNYGDEDAWVALIAPNANPYFPEVYDYTASVALYTWAGTVTSPEGAAQIQNPYGPTGLERPPVSLATPEGFPVYAAEDGEAYVIYIGVSATEWQVFEKDSSAPGDYSTSNRTVQSFLKNHQEVYDGRVAIDMDPDFDGLSTPVEIACNLNPNDNDTDGDGLFDTVEYRACADTDSDDSPDANDTDSDDDDIADGIEDANKNGLWNAGETDALRVDTDGDGINDGVEDDDFDGVRDNDETDPRDRDTDDDGLEDKLEIDGTWCYVGEATGACDAANHNDRKTSALDNDTDDDALLDGQETGLTSPGVHTDVSRFRSDLNAATRTDPMEDDTDGDGILDGTEDLNRNGRVDSSEADPLKWDSDADGLPDGKKNFGTEQNPLWKGEDVNLNGVRDQDADGDWTETDFLANDSDVDGVLDGAEVNGTYCFQGGSCANTAHPLLPLNPDTDGEGLRDGQELAGWVVGIWYERTMEKKENYSVTSDPWDDNSDSDALTDFEEFMNGSDPRKLDTDGDGITDTQEISDKSNITGIEGTPPQIQDVQLRVELVWRANTACLLGQCVTLYTPDHLELHVSFKVTENIGIDFVEVRVTKLSGVETKRVIGDGSKNLPVDLGFGFGLFEALLTGADVNITAYDVNGNGAWGEFHQDSVAQMAVKAIAAMFSAIANAIVEAASAAIDWIWGMISGVLDALFRPILDEIARIKMVYDRAALVFAKALDSFGNTSLDEMIGSIKGLIDVVFSSPLILALILLGVALAAIELTTLPFTITFAFLVGLLIGFVKPMIISALIGVIRESLPPGLGEMLSQVLDGVVIAVFSQLSTFGAGVLGPAKTTRGPIGDAMTAATIVVVVTAPILGFVWFLGAKAIVKAAKVLKSPHLDRFFQKGITIALLVISLLMSAYTIAGTWWFPYLSLPLAMLALMISGEDSATLSEYESWAIDKTDSKSMKEVFEKLDKKEKTRKKMEKVGPNARAIASKLGWVNKVLDILNIVGVILGFLAYVAWFYLISTGSLPPF